MKGPNGGFPKQEHPQIIHFSRIVHWKSSIWGTPYVRKAPNLRPAPWLAEAIAPAAVVGAAQQPETAETFHKPSIDFFWFVNHILVHPADGFDGSWCINMLVSALYCCVTALTISKAAR